LERGGGRQDFLAGPAVAGLIEQEFPPLRAARNRRLHAGRDIDESAVGIVNDRQRGILCLRQLVESLVVPDGIESVLRRPVERMSAIA